MDLDLDLDDPRDRSPLQQMLDLALMAAYAGGQVLRTLWRLMGAEALGSSTEAEMEECRPSRRHPQRKSQKEHHYNHQGGEGDYLRYDEILLAKMRNNNDKKHQYPRLVTVVCGFPKNFAMYPRYVRGKFGEDAWFHSSSPQADTLGVADGVGGWRSYGIDPGEFSDFLMRSCHRLATNRNYDARRLDWLLSRAYLDLLEQKCPVLGSSTVCLLSLNRENSTVYTANIGDSGFLAVRSGRILCRSLEQQHQFNTPYQLSSPPPNLGGQFLIDSPDSADFQEFKTRPGDVLLLATDGVYDNLPLELILEVLSEMAGVEDQMVLQMTANSLALMARTLSTNPLYDSPFSRKARKMNVESSGGKRDDITVLLASVI